MRYFTKELVNSINTKKQINSEEEKMLINAVVERKKALKFDFPTNEYSFQNIKIKITKKLLNNFIIKFETKGEYSDSYIKSLTFKNAKIIKKDNNIEDSIWIFDEVYKENDKYEVHILLKKDEELLDLILLCNKASITYTELGKNNKIDGENL